MAKNGTGSVLIFSGQYQPLKRLFYANLLHNCKLVIFDKITYMDLRIPGIVGDFNELWISISLSIMTGKILV